VPDPIKVFVSYRRADTQHVAGRFADKIADRFQVFMDIDTIPPGVDFTDYVRRAVSSCDVLLAFIGEHWAGLTDDTGRRRLEDPSDWVAEEIRTALQRDVRVIPVLVDDAALPAPETLPESLRPLTTRQTLPLRHASFSADTARLITAVQAAAVRGEDPTPDAYGPRWETTPAPPAVQVHLAAPKRSRRSPRALIWVVLAVAAVTLALSLGLIIRHSTGQATSPPDAAGLGPAELPSTSAGSGPSSSTSITTSAELLTHIPAAVQAGCRELTPEAAALRPSLQAAVQCTPPEGPRSPHYVFYFAYRDTASAQRAFHSYYAATPLPAGDCRRGEAELQYGSQGGRPATGTLVCYVDAGGLRVNAWTNDELAVVASTADRHLAFDQLHSWWEQAGPRAVDR
jgi:hypothetical protein